MSEPNGIGMRREDDKGRVGCLPGAFGLGIRDATNDVYFHAYQLGCRLLQLLDRLRPAKLNDKILALNMTESAQPRPQRLYVVRITSSATETEVSDPPNLGRLLRTRHRRPREQRRTGNPDQLAAPHRPVRWFCLPQFHHDSSLVTGLPNARMSRGSSSNFNVGWAVADKPHQA